MYNNNGGKVMVEQYPNSPLAEALFEVEFESDSNWDWTIPGNFYNEIKEDFPNKEQKNNLVINLENREGEIVPSKDFAQGKKGKIIFSNNEKNKIIQIAPDVFTINQLRPYPGWEIFSREIKKYFEMYLQLIGKVEISKINLRYINSFENLEIENNSFEEYFNFKPNIPIDRPIKNFFIKNQLSYLEMNSDLILNLGKPLNNKKNIILDFNFITKDENNKKNYDVWLNRAHNNIEEAFQSCITKKTKKILKGENNNEW